MGIIYIFIISELMFEILGNMSIVELKVIKSSPKLLIKSILAVRLRDVSIISS